MTQELLFERKGQIGLITLNRPKALNALTLEMIQELQKQLLLWKKDEAIKAVVIQAVPGTAFCAGGDVRWLYQLGAQHIEQQMEFFWHEYRLNHFIHHLGKPYIALMDGITMGGGVGISLHGSHPVASERFSFAMPETSIGFFPDIGSSHLLTRCPNAVGIYLGLTGNRLNADEAKEAGLVKSVVSSDHISSLLEELIQNDLTENAYEKIDECLARYAQDRMVSLASTVTVHTSEGSGDAYSERMDPPLARRMTSHEVNGSSKRHEQFINECFALETIESILIALEEHPNDSAKDLVHVLKQKSPFSLKLTLAQLQKARGLSLADCLTMDFNLVRHFMTDHDFYEGVRALLVDKDKNPQWQPNRLDLVSEAKIKDYFKPITKTELSFFAII